MSEIVELKSDDYNKMDSIDEKGNYDHQTEFWLSMDIRLDEMNYKNQTFTITGWINAFWDILSVNKNYNDYFNDLNDKNFEVYYNNEYSIYKYNISRIHESEQNNCTLKILSMKRKILEDLCPFYGPNHYNCLFYGNSVQSIEYLDPIKV